MSTLSKPIFVCAVTMCACGGPSSPEDVDDHPIEAVSLEGEELAAMFAGDGVSDVLRVDAGFRRVGLLWDADAAGAIEVRTSLDGETWSDWAAPELVSAEDQAHAGHLDAIAVGDEGSFDDDPLAGWLQVRVPAGATAPTFLVIEPLLDIPPAFDPDAVVEVEEEETDLGGTELFSDLRSTPIGAIRIYSRADWGARAPRCASGSMTPNRATIHHTVTPTNDSMTPQARLRQIQSYHMYTNGWCDIGYNYLISRDGRVWRARGATTIGAHVANSNTGNIGISFMGTYTSTAPTSTQMCNAAKLLRRLSMDFGGVDLNRTDVKGHRQYGSTACPGNALYNRIDAILRKARGGCGVQ
jgi:hypothetical protein